MKATITKVCGPDIRVSDPFTGKRSDYGSYVEAQDEEGKQYVFINGSLNQVAPEHRRVGLTGTIRWMTTTSSNLPYFMPDPEQQPRSALSQAIQDHLKECPPAKQVFPDPFGQVQKAYDPSAPGRYYVIRRGQPTLWFHRKADAQAGRNGFTVPNSGNDFVMDFLNRNQ